MVYDKNKWIAAFQKAVNDLKTDKPTSGLPCAVAAIRYMRDGLLDDIGPADDAHKDDKLSMAEIHEMLRDSFKELLNGIAGKNGKGVEDGFLSNASAAAKAAGYKSVNATLSAIEE